MARTLKSARPVKLLLALGLAGLVAVGAVWLSTEIYVEIQFQKAKSALARYDFAGAREHLQTCVRLRPDRFQIRFLAAQTARRAGNYEEALEHLERCEALVEDPADFTLLESTLLRAQRGEVALVERPLWQLVEKDHPEKVLILEAMARGYIQVYCLPLADRCLKMLLKEEPDHAEAWAWRAAIYDMLDNRLEAQQYYERALELRPDNDTCRLHLASFLQHSNRVREAFAHLQKLYERQPDNPDVLVGLARYYMATSQYPRAGEMLVQALAQHPDHGQGLAEQGRLYLLEKKPVQAEACLRRALAADPSDRAYNYMLYQCLKRAGKEAAARVQHARFKQLDKDLSRTAVIMRYDLAKEPRNPDLYYELGRIFSRHGRADRGLFWYQHALTLNPNHRRTHQALAAYFESAGKKEYAALHREKARRIVNGQGSTGK
jgi:tetratricopeptide (TPR) repeat protein